MTEDSGNHYGIEQGDQAGEIRIVNGSEQDGWVIYLDPLTLSLRVAYEPDGDVLAFPDRWQDEEE